MNIQKIRHLSVICSFILTAVIGFMIDFGCVGNGKTLLPVIKSDQDKSLELCRIELTWENVPDADSYNLYVSKVPGAKKNGEKVLDVSNPYTINGLEVGETYYFVVTSVENGIESDASNEISHAVDK